MVGDESLYPADWLRIAEQDLVRVEVLLVARDPGFAGFCLQQALEKFLKAFLLSKGWELQRIHDLEALLNAALAYDQSLEPFRAQCQRITDFYLADRYPRLTQSGLTEQDIRDALEQVGELIARLRSLT